MELAGGPHEVRDPLLAGDAADERHDGPIRVHAVATQHRTRPRERLDRRPHGGVDPVEDHVDTIGVDLRVDAENLVLHPSTDRHHRVRVRERIALGPRGDPVAATELLGLPGATGFERVRRHHMRDPVQLTGEVAGEARVPGVGVHDVRAFGADTHPQSR